jgi:hypothetical protein
MAEMVEMKGTDSAGRHEVVPVLSLRDYFAAAALTGLCALGLGASANAPAAAARAYAMADAMLAVRGTHGP